ncbi:AAA family ATP:ADP antiporter [Paraburkholderia silvatlantica]|uniref:AAA family ATP:ADP antiporter n=1 Tax=Paraburkholderia silvatlantica TaxID=321895 RepID=A0A2V4TQ86_9BURK|nr:MFS transporter [Paraburkholderia silvatlantica]PYE19609.1 AAA family ATP:ADP antiporter [Paraburkholderia silvatlantica]
MSSDAKPETGARRPTSWLAGVLRTWVPIMTGEGRPLIWCWLYVFCVLCSYYVIRPIRDAMGIDGGVRNLQWLFSATLVCMLLANLPFAALARRLPRTRFIAIAYRFFIVNLLVFAILLSLGSHEQSIWIGRVFFVWVSVFNLFVVSVFWELVVDTFDDEQGRRLFALMAAGATLGAIVGAAVTATLNHLFGPVGLLVLSAILLEVSVRCVRRIAPVHRRSSHFRSEFTAIGGTVLAGISRTIRSPYLASICVYILLFSMASTTLYFEQANVIHRTFASGSSRVTFFATLDFVGNLLTLLMQILVTGHIIRRFGVTLTLVLIPALSVVGFAFVALWSTFSTVVVFSLLRRAGNFAIARPTREILFTKLDREDKYKAKSFIDTVIYRAGDQIGAWTYAGFESIGMSGGGMAIVAMLLSLLWLMNSLWLGRRHESGVIPAGPMEG